jgi:hypothetical protein
MSHNIPKTLLARIEVGGKKLTAAEFYAYWQGVFDLLASVVTNDPP